MSEQSMPQKPQLVLAEAWQTVEGILAALMEAGADKEKLSALYDTTLAIAQSADAAKRKVKALKAALVSEQEARTALVEEFETLKSDWDELTSAIEKDEWGHPLLEEFVERVGEYERDGFWEFEDEIEKRIRGEMRGELEDARADLYCEIESEVREELEEEVEASVEDRLRSEIQYLAAMHLNLKVQELDLHGLMVFLKGYTSTTAEPEKKQAMAQLLKAFGAKEGNDG